MKIKQFEDKGLAHFSYAILSEQTREVMLIDPARDPQPYYDYAAGHDSKIVGVIETHPHADFVSSHLEIQQQTGATIYTHSLVGADYPHQAFDEGAELQVGEVKYKSLHTPGHSPDGISIVVEHEGKDVAVFTGDTLFIGDVGRPDLRESAGNVTAKREELARQLYHSTREKLMKLSDEVVVYPAHGAGSLCGKGLSEGKSSTIGAEKMSNYALRQMSEEEFVHILTEDQPFIPKYFSYDVALNKQGAPAFKQSIAGVNRMEKNYKPEKGALVVDARSEKAFKQGHYKGALNIQNGAKFETWLGSIVEPEEKFYLMADSEEQLNDVLAKAAKIGYELLIKGAFVADSVQEEKSPLLKVEEFRKNMKKYTIVDIRNESEVKGGQIFEDAINIPLPQLRERVEEVPADKTVVVHCAGGYRSAAGFSILKAALPDTEVLDLSEAVNDFNAKK
ncbi:glyoxylase-like metal-dependent hydrolase (beta-lactamase superfamily II) [Pontibacter mucosus]|uniref:Glyoxylase-like metal-dependent hydrolase (Beta-lactamase superfamily II) n=1 Tax=Pontibacter mucosus TaxID=1649266 RepID=A0A2T5YCL6_9BACT|nr:rhodanese-like domain-containing protein [Pontibacter mucosus]PTX14201.1 glyoxylase-like metal-dependent hydrolase (beta-lactamase superfamily II) [Pontibacter mucosus]